jgi:hypothetical protein
VLEMRFLEDVDFPAAPRVEKGLFDEWSVTWGGRHSWTVGSEPAARFVAEALHRRGRVRHGDTVRVALPADLDRAWQHYQADGRALEANPPLKIEAEIDELVFDLYGLSQAARQSIAESVS